MFFGQSNAGRELLVNSLFSRVCLRRPPPQEDPAENGPTATPNPLVEMPPRTPNILPPMPSRTPITPFSGRAVLSHMRDVIRAVTRLPGKRPKGWGRAPLR
jgi:hypothetical protein